MYEELPSAAVVAVAAGEAVATEPSRGTSTFIAVDGDGDEDDNAVVAPGDDVAAEAALPEGGFRATWQRYAARRPNSWSVARSLR